MFGKFASIRNTVAICLALCMPCQAVLAGHCLCAAGLSMSTCCCQTSACCCQQEITELDGRESLSNSPCCVGYACSSCDSEQPPRDPCNCGCQELPPDSLPLHQEDSRFLAEVLQVDTGLISCATLLQLDAPRQATYADTQNASCLVQQPCILFCRFLL